MNIKQIQSRYDELQDRVLLRLSTSDDAEFAFWFTRRFTRRFWTLLQKALEQDEPVRLLLDAEARRAVIGMRHEGFMQQNDFSKPFEEKQYARPLGPDPVLVSRGDYKPGTEPGTFTLSLHPQKGAGVDLGLNASLLHSICKLLIESVARSDWGLELAMPRATLEEALPGDAPRTLN